MSDDEERKPSLYHNATEEDFEAIRLLGEAKIEFETRGPLLGEKTPCVYWPRHQYRDHYRGLEGVKEFIRDYRKEFPYALS